jgi:tRNA-splicing ligase RtcB (3'-phosphate/5'-hydroxy nucleic acid ligase)
MIELNGKYTSAKIMIDEIDPGCISQIYTFLNHPAFTNPVVIMPDTHVGKGSVIGFTMKTTSKIIPNVIGVDIGCGMYSVNLGEIEFPHAELDSYIREKIPFGINVHNKPIFDIEKEFYWSFLTNEFHRNYKNILDEFGGTDIPPVNYSYDWFIKKCKQIGIDISYAECSIGSVGGGNHFIEIGRDKKEDVWLTIHSGSRNLGKKLCEYWQKVASDKSEEGKKIKFVEELDLIKKQYKGKEIETKIKEAREKYKIGIRNDLAWLDQDDSIQYLQDMFFAQEYATVNRFEIFNRINRFFLYGSRLRKMYDLNTIHNYIDFDDFIIRKGSIRSYTNTRMVIPLNMRDGILLCEGKSNPEWNYSAPHGCGRVSSRSKAKETLELEKFKEQMSSIFSTSVGIETLDESPDAYKESTLIMELIEPTAKIIDVIKPIHNIKDKGEEKPWKK